MNDQVRTNSELLKENAFLKQKTQELEQSESERKRAEKALRESEERYRSLVEKANEAIYVAQDGMLKFVNRAGVEIAGYSEQEIISKPFIEFVHPDDRAMVGERYLKRLKGEGYESRYAFRFIPKNGGIKWLELSAALINFEGRPATLNLVTDITDRKLAEEELRKSEEKYRTIIESMEDGYHEVDIKGNFTLFNESTRKMMGYERDALLGMNYSQYSDEENTRKVYQVYNQVYRTGEPVKNFEWQIIRKDGDLRDIEVSISLIRNTEGHPTGFRSIVRDTTDRKRAEAEKLKLEEQYRQAQKMEAIGQLAGGVAHDFNNMLNIILGYSQMALMKIEPSGPLHTNIQEIMNAARRSADLVRQLLAFARKQTIAPKTLDINDTVAGMLNMLRKLIGEDIDLLWMPAANLWPVKMDPAQVDQILANLAVNARDSISGVGKITIETGKAEFDDSYCAQHAGFVPGQYVLLAVSDNGCGMDKETCEQIFEPFFTTNEVGKGTGMGLATVYGIVKQNNGFVNV
ncbi:MAG: PAS domain S-box protein, partial [Desulfobacterales bacterium]|nr:PAS domain S-box protein [Desulfobacterales bacterium]